MAKRIRFERSDLSLNQQLCLANTGFYLLLVLETAAPSILPNISDWTYTGQSSVSPKTLLWYLHLLRKPHFWRISIILEFPLFTILKKMNHFFYIIEEFIQGQSIDTFVSYQKISHELLIKFGIQLCDILDYLHHLMPYPILYQDLKPEHIIVCGNQIKLIDFGIASFFYRFWKKLSNLRNNGFCCAGALNGLPVTPSADVYGLGKVLQYLSSYTTEPVPLFFRQSFKKLLHMMQRTDMKRSVFLKKLLNRI